MDILAKWLLLASVQTAATLSPGPAFAISVRNALAYDRRTGVFTAIGLGAGVGAHVLFVLCGIAVVIAQSVMLFNLIKYAGAAYLIFIGAKAIFARKREDSEPLEEKLDIPKAKKSLSSFGAFRIGFLTNLLNPKAVVFFTAVFSQFISPETSYEVMGLYFLTCVMIETIWFSIVSIVLTNPLIKAKFLNLAHWVERVCGGLLIALGVKLATNKGLGP